MDDNRLVHYPGCRGALSWNENGTHHEAAIAFTLEVDRTGRVRLEIDEQPLTSDNFWINAAHSGSSSVVPSLKLEARNADGHVLRSDHVHLCSVQAGGDPNTSSLKVEAEASRLTVLADHDERATAANFHAEYWVAGLRWFRGARFASAAGDVAIQGDVKVEDYSKVSGTVAVRTPAKGKILDSWLEATDAEVRRILDVVSFADGHFMQPTVRQAFRDERLARVDFFGTRQGSAPHQPPLHCLNFTNTLPPLIHAYDAALIDRTGLDVAIEWHLMPHIYNESRFVAQMTAIEHLIDVFARHDRDSTYIDKKLFKKSVVPALIRTLKKQLGIQSKLRQVWIGLLRRLLGRSAGMDSESDAATTEALEGMTQGLRHLNRRNLRSNLTRMLRQYKVPLDGLSDSIGPLITVRNDIVHRGLHEYDDNGTSLGQRLAEAEELLRRIVLALLGFEGRYTTWLTKVEDRELRQQPPARMKAD